MHPADQSIRAEMEQLALVVAFVGAIEAEKHGADVHITEHVLGHKADWGRFEIPSYGVAASLLRQLYVRMLPIDPDRYEACIREGLERAKRRFIQLGSALSRRKITSRSVFDSSW